MGSQRVGHNWVTELNWSKGLSFPGGTSGKEPACQCRRHKRCWFDPWGWEGLIPGGGHGNPFKYACLENPMDRETWKATVCGVSKNQIQQKRFSTRYCYYHYSGFFAGRRRRQREPGIGYLRLWGIWGLSEHSCDLKELAEVCNVGIMSDGFWEFLVGMPMSTQMCLGTHIWHCTSLCISVCASVFTSMGFIRDWCQESTYVSVHLTNSERRKLCCTKP